MRLNIAPKDCRYIVDKNKKKIVCIIDETEYLFLNFVVITYFC